MLYLTITLSDNTQNTYIAEEFRITKGFLKIINSTYGNRAIPKSDVISTEIIVMEDK